MRKLSIGFHPYPKRKDKMTKRTQIIMRVLIDGDKMKCGYRRSMIYQKKTFLNGILLFNDWMQKIHTASPKVSLIK